MKILFFLFLTLTIWQGQSQDLLLRNVRILDFGKGEFSEPTQLLIENGKIKAIRPRIKPTHSVETLDLRGAYAIPGLIDAHVHLSNDPKESRADRIRHLEYFLQHGITTIRDAAGDARILKDLQNGVRTGEIAGPDIHYAAFIAGPPYYKDNDREKNMVAGLDTPFAPWLQCIQPGADLHQAMKAAKNCGATGIKIYGGFTREELFSLVKAAKAEGLKIWGHAALFPAKPRDVADAGMEVISHAYLLEWENVPEPLSEDFFKNYELFYSKIDHQHIHSLPFITAVKKQGAIFDPTLYLCMVNNMEWSADIVKKAYQADVKICAGTDYINDLSRAYPFLFDEITLYVNQCGFTPLDALRSATLIAAEALGIEKETGSLTLGKQADLLILNDNPLRNIENLKSIHLIIKHGKKQIIAK